MIVVSKLQANKWMLLQGLIEYVYLNSSRAFLSDMIALASRSCINTIKIFCSCACSAH